MDVQPVLTDEERAKRDEIKAGTLRRRENEEARFKRLGWVRIPRPDGKTVNGNPYAYQHPVHGIQYDKKKIFRIHAGQDQAKPDKEAVKRKLAEIKSMDDEGAQLLAALATSPRLLPQDSGAPSPVAFAALGVAPSPSPLPASVPAPAPAPSPSQPPLQQRKTRRRERGLARRGGGELGDRAAERTGEAQAAGGLAGAVQQTHDFRQRLGWRGPVLDERLQPAAGA